MTDCLCCIIFIVAVVAFCGASAYGWANGDPSLLAIGWDSDGNGCGYSPETLDYPYLYWPEPPSVEIKDAIVNFDLSEAVAMLNYGTCVKECPRATNDPIECKLTEFMTENEEGNFTGCQYMIGLSFFADWDLTSDAQDEYLETFDSVAGKWPYRYDTKSLYGFCVPDTDSENASALATTIVDTFYELFENTIMEDKLTSYIADIAYCTKLILAFSFGAVVLSYLWLFIIKLIGGLIVWLSLIIIQLSLIGGGYYVYSQKNSYGEESDYKKWITYAAYGIWGLAALFFCCICCCWTSIRIGIAVYKTTAHYVGKNMKIYFLPAVSYIVAAVWLTIWFVSAIYVFSIGDPAPREGYTFITEMQWSDQTRYMVLFQLFMLFWINAFIYGVVQFIIGASACIWYFEVSGDTGGSGTVGRGLYWAFRYHLGSVAFGSAVIAICQLIRAVFEYYRKKIQGMNKSAIVKFLLCYTSYLLWALEKCIKYITKNAYIQVALMNTFFCRAAWNAFALIVKNVHRFGWVNSIGFILNWFGVCAVSGFNAFLAYIMLTKVEMYQTNVTQPMAPAIAVLLVSYLIVKSFLSIFSFSLDAILQSFLLDESLGFAGQARPSYIDDFKGGIEKYAKPVKSVKTDD